MIELAEKDSDINIIEIKQEMKKRKLEVSESTIRRRFYEYQGKYLHKLSKPLLTDKHRKNRLTWAKKYKNFDWSKVIFTDESTFYLNQKGKKV